MSQSHALSDDQVGQELKKMTAFIKQEAMEKGREIEIKADEEFAIEKSKLVRQETSAMDTQYEKKFKQAQMSQQITSSTVKNKTRLKVLAARQALLDEIFEEAHTQLTSDDSTKDSGAYTDTLKNLILQGAYALNEPKIQLRARPADYDLVRKALETAATEYKQNTSKDIAIGIDESNPQSEGCSGGLSIVGGGGKIDIDNTLDARLLLLQDSALPSIRTTLFGKNENRKFYD